jgi:hypothetical protein
MKLRKAALSIQRPRRPLFGVKILVSLLCFGLAPTVSHAAATIDYHCRLPLVTTSSIENGAPKTETSRDDSVEMNVLVSHTGSYAIIERDKYSVHLGPGYVAFYGVVDASGYADGLDVLTIYSTPVSGGQYAVESRQVTILGHPMASQMVGVCVPHDGSKTW